MILIDSTIYIDWLRNRVDPLRVLEPWINAQAAATCGVVCAEVLRSILNPRQKERVRELFDILVEIPTDRRLWFEAAELAWQLDRKGVMLPLTDIAIAACALSADATIISTDEHFAKIPGVRVRPDLTGGEPADFRGPSTPRRQP